LAWLRSGKVVFVKEEVRDVSGGIENKPEEKGSLTFALSSRDMAFA
jgi:hypothetical protein